MAIFGGALFSLPLASKKNQQEQQQLSIHFLKQA